MSELSSGRDGQASPAAAHRERLRETIIAKLKAWLAANPPEGAERIILFGSVARGDYDGASDADLLVIGAGGLPDGGIVAAAGRDCDLVSWTPVQWQAAREAGHPMARDIMAHGVELWRDPGVAPFR